MSSEGESYLFTQFEATDARGAFPCWDEPSFKIPWTMTLEVPEEHVAICNTPAEETVPIEGGWKRIRYARTPPMPSYLLAIATGPLELVPIEGMSIPGNVVVPRGKSHLAIEAVRVTPPLLKALERYFDRPYPFEKLDLIAVPEFWPGAMENPGAVTFRDTILLVDSGNVTVAQLRTLAAVTAHELAHMWFGDLVTMKWWDDLWLNESFATWLGNKITDQVFPEYGLAVSSVEGTQGAMRLDTQVSARAVRAPVKALDNMLQSADALAYQKGSAVLGMFEAFVGEELFRDGVRHYVNSHEWDNAEADDLWSALSEATELEIGPAMATYLDQPGVPSVRATILGDGKLELQQERFLNFGATVEEEQSWAIPMIVRWSDGEQVRTQKVLLDQPRQVIDLPGGAHPQWLHPNAGEMGYYRWEVSPEMLLDLVRRSDELLDARERVALVGQLSAQLDAGRIGGGDYLAACERLLQDPRPEVVDSALSSLTKVRMAFVTAEEQPAFSGWVRQALRPAIERYGLVAREDEPEAVSLLRPALISWLGKWGRDEDVRTFARETTTRFLEDPDSVDPSITGSCLAVAAVDGDWKLYNTYKKRYEAAEVPRERTLFLNALGNFGDPTMQEAALYYALEGPVRPTEMFGIPMNVGMNSLDDPDRIWNWFTKNYDALMAKLPEMFGAYMPYFAGGCDEQRLIAAREFFDQPEHKVVGQDKTMKQVAEGVMDCVQLRGREGESVRAYLDRHAQAE
jgi:alanyl aminopeptidase